MTASSSFAPSFAPESYSAEALFARQSGQRKQLKNPDYSGSWNWGAFFFSWLWLMNHGKVRLGIAFLILDCIPFVGIVAHVYCGMHGNDLAYDARTFESRTQFAHVQDVWRNWGFACVALLPWIAFGPSAVHQARVAQAHLVAPPLALRQRAIAEHPAARVTATRTPAAAAIARITKPVATPRRPTPPARIAQRRVVVVAARPSHPLDLLAREAHPCESALDSVNAALMAMPGQEKYAASITALHFANRCKKNAIALRTRSIALAQKAIAEHASNSGDWKRDIRESIDVSSGCEAHDVDATGRSTADCHSMVAQEVQLALMWQIDDRSGR
jgi:hypothetical protein